MTKASTLRATNMPLENMLKEFKDAGWTKFQKPTMERYFHCGSLMQARKHHLKRGRSDGFAALDVSQLKAAGVPVMVSGVHVVLCIAITCPWPQPQPHQWRLASALPRRMARNRKQLGSAGKRHNYLKATIRTRILARLGRFGTPWIQTANKQPWRTSGMQTDIIQIYVLYLILINIF